MSGAYADLVPGATRKRSAYEDLLPGRTPAPAGPPAEVADAAVEASLPGSTEDVGPTRLARAAIAAEPAVNAVTPALKTVQAVASGYPVLETAANLATGAVAMPVSGITGLTAAIAKALGADVDVGNVVHKTGEALTYQPKTALGQHLTNAALYPLEKLQELGKAAGERDQDTGGAPESAATVETLVNAVPLLLGVKRGAEQPKAPRAAPEVAAAPKAEPIAPQRIEAPSLTHLSDQELQQVLSDMQSRIERKGLKVEYDRGAIPGEGALLTDKAGELVDVPSKHVGDAVRMWTEATELLSARRNEERRAPKSGYEDLIPEAKAGEVPQSVEAAKLGVDHPDIQAALEQMKGEAGWAEIGGRLIRQKHSEVAGDETITRTKWIPKADWWQDRPGKLNEEQTAEAVRKALAGEPLKKREQLAIDHMVEVANERVAERSRIGNDEWAAVAKDIKDEGHEPTHGTVVDTDLVARAAEIDDAAVEKAAMRYENDDAAFKAEVQRIIDEHEAKAKRVAEDGAEGRGTPQGEAGLELASYTEKELAERANAAKEAEAKRLADEQAAENKRIADAQRDFTLTGSDRTADVNPQQDRLSFGMPAGTAVAPGAAAAAAHLPPQSRVAPAANARPDAIRQAMQELFDTVVSEKHQGAKNLGIYRIKPETVRVRNRNDLRTIAHEVGHHISNRNKPFRAVMRKHDGELVAMMPQAYKQMVAAGKPMTKRLQIEEGFAEFVAEYLGDRAIAKAKAPSFFKAFEQWLDANPRYKAAVKQVSDMIGAHEALSPEAKILAKVGAYSPPWRERAAALVSKDTYDTFVQATLDKWHPLKTMVEDLAPGLAQSKNPYGAARRLAGDAAIIEDWVGNFTSPYDYAKRLDPKNYGPALQAVLEPVLKLGEGEIDKFKAYLIAKRAAELKKVGKENLFTTDEIAAGLALETAQFKQVAAGVYKYLDGLRDYAVEGGLLSPEVAAKFREYAAYIPFFREAEGAGKPTGGRGEPFKRLMGGTANVRDPIANIIENTANIIHATNRNAVLQKAVELAKAVPGGGRWIETVPLPMQAHNLATKRIIEQLLEQGVVIDTQMAENMAAMQTFFTKSGRGDDRTRTIVYKDGGELKAAQVNDPLLWKAIGNMPPLELGLIGKMLAFPAQTLRAGVVLDPTFMVRNFVRDTLSAMVQSKGSFVPIASTAEGIRLMAQQKDAYKLWRSFGGAFADQFREPQESAAVLARMAKRGGFPVSSIISPWRWLDALKKVGSFTESGSRIGEFAKTYKPGDFESALQAALNSREVSTDFGMRGGSDAVQVLARITPFMNPAMQGLYKTARVLSGADGKKAAGKAAMIGAGMALGSVALALINSEEEWYQRIEEWEKTTYWHFKLGDNVYRMAKPFEYGALFASIPEAIALRVAGTEGNEDTKKRILQTLGQVFGFRVIPQAATIVGEPWANKSIFTGRKIVPDKQQHLEPGLQANPSTTKVAQVVGEQANVSPAVIDNVVRNIFGTIGVHISTAADLILESSGLVPKGHERTWQSWPVLKAFVRDPDNPNTKQSRDFYDALEKYRTAVQTVKEYRARGEDDKADAYAVTKSDELASAKSAEAASKRLAKIRKTINAIEWSRDMSPTEKRDAVNESNAQMRDIVEEQTPLYQAAKKSYSRPATEGAK